MTLRLGRKSSALGWLIMVNALVIPLGSCKSTMDVNGATGTGTNSRDAEMFLIPTVGLRFDNGTRCTGIFIREDFVVTSGHCTQNARGASVISLASPFRDRPASQTFFLPPQFKLPPSPKNPIKNPGLDIALLQLTKNIATLGFVGQLAGTPPRRGDLVWLQGFNHASDRPQAKFDAVVKIGSMRIAAIRADANDMIDVEGEASSLPAKEDQGSLLYNGQGQVLGVLQSVDDSRASYVNLTNEEVREFIDERIKQTMD